MDAGATFGDSVEGGPPTDARTLVRSTLPDVMDKVKVIWRRPIRSRTTPSSVRRGCRTTWCRDPDWPDADRGDGRGQEAAQRSLQHRRARRRPATRDYDSVRNGAAQADSSRLAPRRQQSRTAESTRTEPLTARLASGDGAADVTHRASDARSSRTATRALDDVSLTVPDGEFLVDRRPERHPGSPRCCAASTAWSSRPLGGSVLDDVEYHGARPGGASPHARDGSA